MRHYHEYTSLPDLVAESGPVELQRPFAKEDFVALAERYPELRMERESNGFVTLMSPVKKGSGRRESGLHGLLFMWNYQTGQGEVYGPNGSYDLPDGATKMPDASWISPERLAAQGNEDDDEETYIRIVPDFVAEIRSSSDSLSKLQAKMTHSWMANGVRLAWLIDPYEEKAYIYRTGAQEPEVISDFANSILSGEKLMPGFELPLKTMLRRVR